MNKLWSTFPAGAKNLLADTGQDMDLHKLIVFWTEPLMQSTTSNTCTLCGASWNLALRYLEIGKPRTARNLLLNGSFLQEACHNPMRIIASLCGGCFSTFLYRYEVARKAAESIPTMLLFLEKVIPSEYNNLITFGIEKNINDVVNCVSNNWHEGKSMASNDRLGLSREDNRVVCVVLMDKDTEEKVKVEVGRSTTLKSMFNDYAEAMETSLRSLRFSYNGTTLFLSSAKNMTPDQLDMNDLDTIMVTNMDRVTKGLEGNATTATGATHNHNHGHLSSKSNARKKSKRKQVKSPEQPYIVERTQEELKIEVRLACLVLWIIVLGKRAHVSYPIFLFPALQGAHHDTRRGTSIVLANSKTSEQLVDRKKSAQDHVTASQVYTPSS